ncbi:MAG: sigma-70 family RNA polymerase sigma factor [Opitutaceae bacterium]
MNDDPALLRRFVQQRCQRSFAELVQRHLGLVYHAALRIGAGDSQLAEDAAQATFTLLAARAAKLCDHPELAGWLHATACLKARELRRGDLRRHRREQTANFMDDLHGEPTNDEAWQRLRPLIDEVLLDLKPEDRAAVLLRFFEGRAFAEVGAALRLGENAARMRVDRALERLREALARRGVASTGAALGAALSVPATLAAPAGLAAEISGAAWAAGAAAGGSAVGVSTFHLLTGAKTMAVAAGLAAAAAVGTGVYFQAQLQHTRAELAAARADEAELRRRLRVAEEGAEIAAAGQAKAEERARAALAVSAAAAGATDPGAVLTRESVLARYRQALALMREGQWEAGLRELLWCYDVGMVRIAELSKTRDGAVVNLLVEFGEKYPPALAALRERRDAAERRVLAPNSSLSVVLDYAALNGALGEGDKSLVVYDTMAETDDRKIVLGRAVADELLEAKRYVEVAELYPGGMALGLLEASTRGKADANGAPLLTREARQACRTAAKHAEALAGAGELGAARALAAKVLAVDGSPETRALLAKHLTRAGHPELASE